MAGAVSGAGGQFLPTPSARRATEAIENELAANQFLPTPSARRATRAFNLRREFIADFYPRPPRGGRRLFFGPDLATV